MACRERDISIEAILRSRSACVRIETFDPRRPNEVAAEFPPKRSLICRYIEDECLRDNVGQLASLRGRDSAGWLIFNSANLVFSRCLPKPNPPKLKPGMVVPFVRGCAFKSGSVYPV